MFGRMSSFAYFYTRGLYIGKYTSAWVRGVGIISAECHKVKISKGGREQGEMSIKIKRGKI
jgi:hypothetical protein